MDSDNWDLYRSNVVDFLRRECHLNDVFTDDEIFHVLGILDVNSVAIHTSTMTQSNGQQVEARPGKFPIQITMPHLRSQNLL